MEKSILMDGGTGCGRGGVEHLPFDYANRCKRILINYRPPLDYRTFET